MIDLDKKLEELNQELDKDLANAGTVSALDAAYLKYYGTSGATTSLTKQLPNLSAEEKKKTGPIINAWIKRKAEIEKKKSMVIEKQEKDPFIDLTLPRPPKKTGYLHPTNQTIREMNKFFRYYGFSIAEGPEIETAEYNFRKLNLPEGHPATDLQDTLFVSGKDILLRTHTSSVEARILTDNKPPIRVVVPGKVSDLGMEKIWGQWRCKSLLMRSITSY